jgi:DNA-directed RNA polymerase subunit alpha
VAVKALSCRPDTAEAEALVEKLAKKFPDSLDVKVEQGAVLERKGLHEEALKVYTSVLEADPDHPKALFRLAYNSDLRGDEEGAVELYHRVLSHEPAYLNALVNLGIIFDDREDYGNAATCFEKVLRIDPSHPRAMLFYKDAVAAKDMYYDEEQQKRRDKRNRVLEIPVTDFELSVRSRNCLEKMSIRTLGDLTKITEQTLLSFKNFGETSLNEIKQMLATQGLRPGQALEEGMEEPKIVEAPSVEEVFGTEDVTDTPLSEVDVPIRIRRCAELLGATTLGQLAAYTPKQLLSIKNFGQTSLAELQDVLAKHGLKLSGEE